ncbi:sensor histidine kinase [Nonomuraea insulae]|uniref:histidine kinase n=1 Tax=Nonomuraea insulae TaxID=1616787 RepID=A0ABW1D5G5_9ACTN
MNLLDAAGALAAGAALMWALARRPALPWVAGAAGALSLAVTAGFLIMDGPGRGEDLIGLAESFLLIAVTGLVARRSPARRAVPACVLTGAAASTWLLRYLVPASPLEAVGMCAFWSLGVIAAVGVALYLRYLDDGRASAVRRARTEQRLRLAGDLHDFVAHDVGEMLAQAQAGQVVGVADPAQALLALRRVEEAGLRAMETLDRTVLELHAPGLADLPALAARFSAAGPPVRLDLQEGLDVPDETGALAYRIVVEALTNVRRHAPGATAVGARVHAERNQLLITVGNEGGAPATGGPRGGFGLAGLRERVEAAGGELSSAAVRGGWRLTTRLPLPR